MLALVAVAVWVVYYAALVRLMFSELHMNDFGKFYYSARMFLDGQDMYGPSPATAIALNADETRQFWNMNPPHFHLALLPFALLTPALALAAWAAASGLGAAVSARMIARELGVRWSARAVFWLIVVAVLSAATGTVVATGQVTFLLLPLVTAAWVSARRGSWGRAAVLLGVLASVKPFVGIFGIYLLATKRHRPFVQLVAAAGTCFGVGLLAFGPAAHSSWLRALGAVDWASAPMNASVTGVLSRTIAPSPFFRPLIEAPDLVQPLALTASITVGALALWLLIRDRSGEAVDRAFFALLLTAQLVSPLGWIYYLWLAAGPAVALWRSSHSRPSDTRTRLLWLSAPGFFCPLLLTLAFSSERWAGVTVGSVYGWSTLLLWSAFVADWSARRRLPA